MKCGFQSARHVILVGFLFLSALPATGQAPEASPWAEANFDRFQVRTDVVYFTADNYDLKLDLYLPRDLEKPNPTLIYFHGGGWVTGKKDGAFLFALPFLARGWTVVNVGYRLARVSPAPAAVEDCRCALHWVVHHARDYKIDTGRIVLMGHSAGGHLALITGMLPASAGLDRQCDWQHGTPQGQEGEQEVQVAAIVNWFGITDVAELLDGPDAKSYAISWLGSQADRQEVAAHVSPLNFVRPGLPAILTIHGDQDTVVPYSQAERLHEALDKVGASHRLVTIPGGQHGNFGPEKNQRVYGVIWDFLEQHLPAR